MTWSYESPTTRALWFPFAYISSTKLFWGLTFKHENYEKHLESLILITTLPFKKGILPQMERIVSQPPNCFMEGRRNCIIFKHVFWYYTVIEQNPRKKEQLFPWSKGTSLPKRYLFGAQVVWSRHNLTRTMKTPSKVPTLSDKQSICVQIYFNPSLHLNDEIVGGWSVDVFPASTTNGQVLLLRFKLIIISKNGNTTKHPPDILPDSLNP